MDAPETLAVVVVRADADADADAVLTTAADLLGTCSRPFSVTLHLPACRSALDGRKALATVLSERGAPPERAERALFDLPQSADDGAALRRLEVGAAAVVDHLTARASLVAVASSGCRCVRDWDDELRRQHRAAPEALLSAAASGRADSERVYFACARKADSAVASALATLHERPPEALPLTLAGTSLLAGTPAVWDALLAATAPVAPVATRLHELELLLGLVCYGNDIPLRCPTAPLVRAQRGVERPVLQWTDAASCETARRGFGHYAGIDLDACVVYGQAQLGLTRTPSVHECLAKTGGLLA